MKIFNTKKCPKCGGITGYFYHVWRRKMSSRWGKPPSKGGSKGPIPEICYCRDCERRVPMRVACG